MKFPALFAILLAVLPTALAIDQKTSAIIWFSKDSTPDSVIQTVKQDILSYGGKILHEYQLIRGFAVLAPPKAFESVRAMSAEHSIQIEEDEVLSTE
ncbi:Uncharacterized protein ESCO_003717 [Escovopsis weberi]|uniref:Inhibitor I9 domain-containing protein n=1 Tax=Escovopsis weberi TaxID=150374 RepID=A0A0M8N4L3_ESCWE|nr:Uncharacterized protein ESCO_003717 [Escovopsis weberi]